MDLLHSKTFWTGLAGVAAALAAYLGGEATVIEAAQMGLTGLAAVFLRAGLNKTGRDGRRG